MSDIANSEDVITEEKQSRRAIFKDALSRTKSKFKKNDNASKEFKLSDDVNDFLAAGRNPTPTKPSFDISAPTSTSTTSNILYSQPSPRGISVPRLDLSSSTRFPGARAVEDDGRPLGDEFLIPYEKYQRSQSVSSFKKRRTKPRNLSVSFDNAAPVIIGEGGDEAEMPVMEISRIHHRTRSLSPMARRPVSEQSNKSVDVPGMRRKPPPPMIQLKNESNFQPKPVRRVQTGFDESMRPVADREYEQILQSPASGSGSDSIPTPLYSPIPIRPPVPVPSLDNHVNPNQQQLKSPPRRPHHSPPRIRPIVKDTDSLKQGTVQVLVAEGDDVRYNSINQRDPSPARLNGLAGTNIKLAPATTTTMIPQYTVTHRDRPSVNETKTTGYGVGGWL